MVVAGLKRVPSFSARPDFPQGLQVLVIDGEGATQEVLRKQLLELSYYGQLCGTIERANQLLTASGSVFDVVLCEAKLLSAESVAVRKFLQACRNLPLVLMNEDTSAGEVLKGIKMGAVDFLEKPVSLSKLKNIWQHVVRLLMSGSRSSITFDTIGPATSSGTKKSGAESVPMGPKTPSPSPSAVDFGSLTTSNSKAGDGDSCTSDIQAVKCIRSSSLPEVEGAGCGHVRVCGKLHMAKDDKQRLPCKRKASPGNLSQFEYKTSQTFSPTGMYAANTVTPQQYMVPASASVGWHGQAGCVVGMPMMMAQPAPAVQRAFMPGAVSNLHMALPGSVYPMGTAPFVTAHPAMPLMPVQQPLGCHNQGGFGDGLVTGGYFYPPMVELKLAEAVAQPEKLPLGLRLRKSESLLNLVHDHLNPAF